MPLSLPTTNQEAMIAFVDRRHPAYHHAYPHWRFCEETYEGGRGWFEKNIHPYLKEGVREFNDRQRRAYRFNHTKEIISLVTKYIFKEGVIRNIEDASGTLQAFWDHSTMDGGCIDNLMQQICDKSSETGRIWVAVDSKNTAGEIITKADQAKGKNRIYAYMIKQQDVLDFRRDEWGQLAWILYKIKHRDDENPVTSSGLVLNRFMLWTTEEWVLMEEHFKNSVGMPDSTKVVVLADPGNASTLAQSISSGIVAINQSATAQQDMQREIVVIDRGLNMLGEVPVFASDHIKNTEHYNPPGLIDDISYLDRAVANYLSCLDEVIQGQTFSQLVMPAQGLMPGEEGYNKMLEMGVKRIFLYDGEGGAAPAYISPDGANAAMILQVIKMIIGEIYHSVGMAGERTKQDNAQGIDNSSGVAKAYDFDRLNALLVAKAEQLQRTEDRLAYFVRRWAGETEQELPGVKQNAAEDEADSLIKYPDSYDVRALPDEFEVAQNLALLEAPETMRRQQMTAIMNKLFPRLAKDLIAAMQSDLLEWPPDPVEQAQEMLTMQAKIPTPEGTSSGSVQTESGGASGSGGGKTPPSKNKQGQNPGKPKVLSKK